MGKDDSKIKIVTHGGGFHSDDIFAVASLMLIHKDEEVIVVRSRDEKEIVDADYVVDTGGTYDAEKNIYDHHQKEGAGARENGIPYASFGLVWKHFGEKVAGNPEAAKIIDKKLVQSVDAFDNGVDIIELKVEGVYPFTLQGVMYGLGPVWGESDRHVDDVFMNEAVPLAQKILQREIVHANSEIQAKEVVDEMYQKADDKRVILFEEGHGWRREVLTRLLSEYPEPIYFIRPHEDGVWQLVCAMDDAKNFEKRKPLPESWAGKFGKELQEATGVSGAKFCHRGRFMCIVGSKEGAMRLAERALESDK